MTGTQLSGAQMRLWANLAVASVDIETTRHPRGGYRVVEVAVMTSRSRRVSSRWSRLVNPEIPIDTHSEKVHGITDEAVQAHPVFSDIATELVDHLTASTAETLVVVCHNARFDLPILRAELQRVGLDLPSLPVLDTMGKLPAVVGVHPRHHSLEALCGTLDVPYSRQHQAGGDALSVASVIWELFDRAVGEGLTNIEAILEATGNLSTDRYHRQPDDKRPARRSQVPTEHLVSHGLVLAPEPSESALDEWAGTISDCVRYRCEELSDLVARAEASPSLISGLLDAALDKVAMAGDGPGVATLLSPRTELVVAELTAITTTQTRRNRAIKLSRQWLTTFGNLTSCGDDDPCPDCLDYLPCPLDTWLDTLAAVAVGTNPTSVHNFYKIDTATKEKARTFYRWLNNGDVVMAWAGAAAVVDFWVAQGNLLGADRVAQYTYEDGCRHPTVVARWATTVAGPATVDHLRAAIGICDDALAHRRGSTSVPWVALARTRRRLDGLRRRVNGAPGLDRRRRPAVPPRTHPSRFVARPQ